VNGSFVVESLATSHVRSSFDSGIEGINRYFREQVTQDIRRRVTNCFVALDAGGIVAGYYTFAAASLPVTELSPDEVKRLPRYPVLPAGLIGRLAVDQRFKGQGLGGALIVDAIQRAMRAEPAIFAQIVDAKDDTALNFYRHFGFRQLISRPMSLFLPVTDAAHRLNSS